ncbi:unnamed protein product [Rhizoctonia solani]|uniref:DDE-1 domain-containing protein n=1 Tax=Rhizoctonia solani TaxID=456999 RepID=A0A8H2XYM8_9AGAM|nr:unnamed protein product [Rhizoctonia solani]
MLSPYPNLVNDVIEHLKIARGAGVLITRAIAHSAILGFIQSQPPALLQNPKFKISDSFVRRFLADHLRWSYRSTTQSSQKLPADWMAQCKDMAMRLAWNIGYHRIPAELIVNADQTGVAYLGTGDKTWELKGVKQVPAIGKGDKRQFTMMVAIAASGTMLPWQAIFKGKTNASLPSPAARHDCEAKGFCFSCGGEKSWSNLNCLQQKAILLIDCWSVHRGAEFRTWMRMNCPRVILMFIPGGCTGVAQPCDLSINRPLKHRIKTACINYLATETQRQLARGVSATNVTIDTSPGALRNASTKWLLSSWEWFAKNPDAVKKSWSQAVFQDWDLSYETLSSERCQSIVQERFTDDPTFAISVCTETPHINDSTTEEDLDGPDYDDDIAIDPHILFEVPQSLPTGIENLEGSLILAENEEFVHGNNSEVEDSDGMDL